MGAPFPNPVVAGGGALVLPSIHSPNFKVSPLTGWSIDQDGNAYFASITLPTGATVQVYYQATAPTGSIATGSLWFDTASGNQISRWDGSAWVAVTWDAGNVLGAGTISASLLVAGIVVAGIIDGTTITGAQFVADGTAGEVLIYSGTPAAGNLIGSWAAAGGTDPYSNTYPAGLSIGGSTLPQVLLQPGSPHASLSFPLNAATAFTDPLVKAGAVGTPEFASLVLSGPVHPTQQDQVYVELNSSDGTSSANGQLAYLTTGGLNEEVAYWDDTGFAVLYPLRVGAQSLPATPSSGVILWGDTNGNLEKLTPSGRYATLSDGSVSYASHTVTSSSLSVLTDTWIVPPNDPVPGTCYRLNAWGSGTWGSTQQQANWVLSYNGGSYGTAGIGKAAFAAGEAFEWDAEAYAVVAQTGTSGTITYKLIVRTSSNAAGATSSGAPTCIRTGSFTVDTTSQINLSLDFFWTATTGSPTITGRGSLFERLGA